MVFKTEDKKVIIISAPSGAGKTTIVRHLLSKIPQLGFSISATTRIMRDGEQNGREYYFVSTAEFQTMISEKRLLEWQEVYVGNYYGTPCSEVTRLHDLGKIPIFDVDVVGGVNIKKLYGNNALSIFIKPLSFEILEQRLYLRASDSEESLRKRLEKAKWELGFESQFDKTIVNNVLEIALETSEQMVREFIQK